jgi:hypothetical protein
MIRISIKPLNSPTINIGILKPNKEFKELLRSQLKIDSGYYYCEAQNWSKDKPDAFAGVPVRLSILLFPQYSLFL